MANGDNKLTLAGAYKVGVIILLGILSFLGANIYNKVDNFPREFVTFRQYDCDTKEIKDAIRELGKKFDRFIYKHQDKDD
jgi:hypothetical protein